MGIFNTPVALSYVEAPELPEVVKLIAALALASVKYSCEGLLGNDPAPSNTSPVTKLTVPVYPFTEATESVLSTFCQAVPANIAQSPTFQSVMPLRFVEPSTLTI